MTNDWFTQEKWLAFRESSGFNAFLHALQIFPRGRAKCHSWAETVEQKASESGFVKVGCVGDSAARVREMGFTNGHVWVERERDGQRYIADGTAGQIDPDKPMGYYGLFEDAPELLKQVYASRA